MKYSSLFAFAGALLLTLEVGRADTISDGSPVAPAGGPKSTFVNEPGEPGFGKDPFHPNTTRFKPKKVELPAEIKKQQPIPDSVVLRGISMTEGRRLAIISNQTVGEGEEFNHRVGNTVLKLKCVTIKDKSVIVAAGEATRELTLRASFQ